MKSVGQRFGELDSSGQRFRVVFSISSLYGVGGGDGSVNRPGRADAYRAVGRNPLLVANAGYPDQLPFCAKFRQRYNAYPSYNAQNSYVGLHLLAAAANDAGTTETEAVIAALEGRQYEAPMGPLTLRADDHQAIVDVSWGKTIASPEHDFRVLEPIKILDGESVTRSLSATGYQTAYISVNYRRSAGCSSIR